MANRRIVALEEAEEIKDDMYLPVDHESDGTQKLSIGDLVSKSKLTFTETESGVIVISSSDDNTAE